MCAYIPLGQHSNYAYRLFTYKTNYLSVTLNYNSLKQNSLCQPLHFSINIHTDKQAVDEQAKQAKTSAVNFINKSSLSVRNNHLI